MGLQGNFRTMMLADVLQWLDTGQRTGILHIRSIRGISKQIFFERGSIVSTRSSDPTEYLGQFLISRGYLTEEQLNRAMETQLKSGIMLGKILVMVGIIEEPDLEVVLKLKAEESIYDLFLWDEGEFTFEDLEALEEGIPRVHLHVMSIVMEGIRRKDEWGRIRRAFPSSQAVLEPVASPREASQDLPDDSLARRALSAFDGKRSLEEIAIDLHATEFHLSDAAFKLYEHGLLRMVGEREPPEEKSRALIVRLLLEEASRALMGRRFAEAANIYRFLAKAMPGDDEVRRGRALAEEGLAQAYFRDVVPLTTILELAVPLERLSAEKLSPTEGFLASRVNGNWDISEILQVSPLSERDALKALHRLLDQGILRPKA